MENHSETKLKKNSIEKQDTPGNKTQVKRKHSLFISVSCSFKLSQKVSENWQIG